MTRSMVWIATAALLTLAGCSGGPAHPSEEEVKARLTGNYCSDDLHHRLELLPEGRYISKRDKKSPFGNPMAEKCEGNYSLNYNDEKNVWTLELAASDKNSNPFVKCKAASIEIWKGEGGYVVGENPVRLTEPFEQQVVESNKCGEL